MRAGRSLSDAKIGVLKAVSKLVYATIPQIGYWSDDTRHQSRCYALVSSLVDAQLIKRHDALQPYIFSLTREGYRVLAETPPLGSRQESWSVLTHCCHANETEIKLRKHFKNFEFLPKKSLYKMGLNPAIAEHCGVSEGERFYVLVDDYYMLSSRLGRVLTRAHRPKKNYFDFEKPIPNWKGIVSKCICATTTDQQYGSHKSYLKANKLDFAMMKVETLW